LPTPQSNSRLIAAAGLERSIDERRPAFARLDIRTLRRLQSGRSDQFGQSATKKWVPSLAANLLLLNPSSYLKAMRRHLLTSALVALLGVAVWFSWSAMSFASGWITSLSLAEQVLAAQGLDWPRSDAYRMPSGIWCVSYFPKRPGGSLIVYVSWEHGKWRVSQVDLNGERLPSSNY
jgi:hypothetical protein